MKLFKRSKYPLLLFIISILLIYSCHKDNGVLDKACSHLIEGEPNNALDLLSNINDPENMDKESYMQYIAINVGAKYETKQSSDEDTVIFEAQQYFNTKGKSDYTSIVNYYAAQLHDNSGDYPKALESYMSAANATSGKYDTSLLTSKSFNNIGYIYYQQEVFDSAAVNYRKALSYYDKMDKADVRKLKILTNVGRAYEVSNQLDSAYFYFDMCLSSARETENKIYEFHSLKNLGVTFNDKGEYDKAIEYYKAALSIDVPDEISQSETPKIYLYLLNIYNNKGDIKSAKQYTDLVTSSLTEVAPKSNTLKEMYGALAYYYQQTGDYKTALEYRDMEIATKEQISSETNTPALLGADKSFYIKQKDKEAQILKSDVFFLILLGVIVICIVLAFVLLLWREHKKGKAEILACTEKYDILEGMLLSMSEKHTQIEDEIKSMLEDD